MNEPIVVCDHGFVNASLVPAPCLGKPGHCPSGVYETLLWDRGQVSDWEEHLERLAADCRYSGIPFANCERIFTRSTLDILAAENGMEDARCRLRLMVYLQPQTLVNTNQKNFKCVAALWPAPAVEPTVTAFKCAVSPALREAGDVSFNYKLLGRMQADIDLAAAAAAGFEDTLYFNSREELCEATYSNVWLVKDGQLFTPPIEAPCLPGIVRGKIIAAARKRGIPIDERSAITGECIAAANEMFLSSSVRGIQRVTAVEGLSTALGRGDSALISALSEQVMI